MQRKKLLKSARNLLSDVFAQAHLMHIKLEDAYHQFLPQIYILSITSTLKTKHNASFNHLLTHVQRSHCRATFTSKSYQLLAWLHILIATPVLSSLAKTQLLTFNRRCACIATLITQINLVFSFHAILHTATHAHNHQKQTV